MWRMKLWARTICPLLPVCDAVASVPVLMIWALSLNTAAASDAQRGCDDGLNEARSSGTPPASQSSPYMDKMFGKTLLLQRLNNCCCWSKPFKVFLFTVIHIGDRRRRRREEDNWHDIPLWFFIWETLEHQMFVLLLLRGKEKNRQNIKHDAHSIGVI